MVFYQLLGLLVQQRGLFSSFTTCPLSYANDIPRPLIGGSLARPAERFPGIFGDSAFFKKYPYFLQCSVSATVTALSWLIALLFMKEVRQLVRIKGNDTYYFHPDHETSNDTLAIPFWWNYKG